MEFFQDWGDYLHYLTAGPFSSLATYTSYLQRLTSFSNRLSAFFSPLLNQLTTSPDLASIALLLICLVASLMILDYVWRAIMFWVRLIFKLAFWGSMVALGLWIWTRGPDGVMEDIGTLASVWSKEYAFWKEQAEVSQAGRRQQHGGTSRGGGYPGGRGSKTPRWR